jgi:hypothetical protein
MIDTKGLMVHLEVLQLIPVHSSVKHRQGLLWLDLVEMKAGQSWSGNSLRQEIVSEWDSNSFAD